MQGWAATIINAAVRMYLFRRKFRRCIGSAVLIQRYKNVSCIIIFKKEIVFNVLE